MGVPNKKEIRLLIVEDEELIRTMVKLNLENEGYNVTAVKSGEEMLECISKNNFNLILLDIMLPGITGEEALVEIRSKGLKTPVIMVSAKSDTETKVKSFESGADDYILKPFDQKELLARVKILTRRNEG